jgi:hypothetical protein
VEQIRVSVDLMLVDRPVRLAEEGIDIRVSPQRSSDGIDPNDPDRSKH